jgi:hypothetical protein
MRCCLHSEWLLGHKYNSTLQNVKSKGEKIVFEYNAIYLFEEKVSVQSESSVFTNYRYYNEKFLEKRTAKFADVIVGVTREICEYYSSFNPGAPKFVLSNGINPERFGLKQNPGYDGKTIKFLFLSGGSTHYWHGLDRLLEGIRVYQGDKKIEITIAGPGYRDFEKYKNDLKNVSFHFYDSTDGEALSILFDKNHIGIGSMGLHRKNLKEASVLKVREYIVRGMPFMIGYDDTDLKDQPVFEPFFMKVKDDDSVIKFEDVARFADNILARENYIHEINRMGTPLIDYQPKIDRLVKILKSL